MKPFESGLPAAERDKLPRDAAFLKMASGAKDVLDEINPYIFEAALSPEAASNLEHIDIDLGRVGRIFSLLRERHDILVIEGAGGVLVPIRKGFHFADLIKSWDIPVIVVSRLGLGTINHTLLTNAFLQSMGIPVLGVILNNINGEDDIAAKTNPDILRHYLNVPIFGIFPQINIPPAQAVIRELLADTFARHIDTEAVIRALGLKV